MNLARQTPQGKQGGTVPNMPGPGEGTAAPGTAAANAEPTATPGAEVSQATAAAPGIDGVQTPAPDGGAASPTTVGEIMDNVYYLVDPSRPDERLLGSKVRESIHRARTVDDMQSRLHKSLTELEAMKTQLTVAQGQNKEFVDNARLQEQLANMGVTAQAQTPAPGYPTPAPATPIGNPTDEWGLGIDPLGTGQSPAPAPATGQPQNSPLPNPTEFLQLVENRVNELVDQRLGNVNDSVATAVGQSVGLVEEQRSAREMATRTFATSREADAQSLRNIGVDETEISRILDMGQQALERHQEASLLMGITGPDAANSRELARLALVEGQRLNSVAAEARAQAYIAWDTKKVQIEAQQVLEEGGYAGVDMTDIASETPGERLYLQKDVDADRKKKLDKAKEIMAAQSRVRAAAAGG